MRCMKSAGSSLLEGGHELLVVDLPNEYVVVVDDRPELMADHVVTRPSRAGGHPAPGASTGKRNFTNG